MTGQVIKKKRSSSLKINKNRISKRRMSKRSKSAPARIRSPVISVIVKDLAGKEYKLGRLPITITIRKIKQNLSIKSFMRPTQQILFCKQNIEYPELEDNMVLHQLLRPNQKEINLDVICDNIIKNKNHLRQLLEDYMFGDQSGEFKEWAQKQKDHIVEKYGTIEEWNTSAITDMSELFITDDEQFDFSSFNYDIRGWDTSNVTNMEKMFFGATSFNIDISEWDTSKVTNMNRMFEDAKSFTKDISKWKVNNVIHHENVFTGCPLSTMANRQPIFTAR